MGLICLAIFLLRYIHKHFDVVLISSGIMFINNLLSNGIITSNLLEDVYYFQVILVVQWNLFFRTPF